MQRLAGPVVGPRFEQRLFDGNAAQASDMHPPPYTSARGGAKGGRRTMSSIFHTTPCCRSCRTTVRASRRWSPWKNSTLELSKKKSLRTPSKHAGQRRAAHARRHRYPVPGVAEPLRPLHVRQAIHQHVGHQRRDGPVRRGIVEVGAICVHHQRERRGARPGASNACAPRDAACSDSNPCRPSRDGGTLLELSA